jgi:SAM-dependent methyltransferase
MQTNTPFRTGVSRHLEMIARRAMLRAYRSPKLNRAVSAVERSADLERIERLRREVARIYREQPYSAAKYADLPLWLRRNLLRAARLGLHESSGLRILDIGAGPGYFIAAARALGHDCRGIDVAESCFTPLERRVYSELLESLNCRQHVAPVSIERFVPYRFGGEQYDLITAFLTCFNRHAQPDVWGVREWRFFVEDALGGMRPGGRLFVGLNEDPKRFGSLQYYDATLLEYFQSVGTVKGANLLIVNKTSSQNSFRFRPDEPLLKDIPYEKNR